MSQWLKKIDDLKENPDLPVADLLRKLLDTDLISEMAEEDDDESLYIYYLLSRLKPFASGGAQ